MHRRSALVLIASALIALIVGTSLVPAEAGVTGTVSGTAADTHGRRLSGIQVRVFSVADGVWAYRTTLSATRQGDYTATDLTPGQYVLQFVDTRHAYDKTKHVTTDVKATVPTSGQPVTKNAFMHVGASLWGRATRHHKTAPSTLIRAVRDGDTTGTVYASRADGQGRYLLGGLPRGTYTVFSYDRSQAWTGKVRRITLRTYGKSSELNVAMNTRAGRYTGVIRAGGLSLADTVTVTAVNTTTGQYWVATVRDGDLSVLRGLSPGRYTLTVPGADRHLGKTFTLRAITAGHRTDAGALNLNRQGGKLVGTVIDATSSEPLPGVEVTINDRYGHPYETVTSDSRGRFDIGGAIADGDNPVSLTLRLRHRINEIRYLDRDRYAAGEVTAGTTVDIGTVSMSRAPDEDSVS